MPPNEMVIPTSFSADNHVKVQLSRKADMAAVFLFRLSAEKSFSDSNTDVNSLNVLGLTREKNSI